jgi:hypothetical protein
MSGESVREVGTVADAFGLVAGVGVDRGAVTVRVGARNLVLEQEAAEEFARLFVHACWEAAQQGVTP